MGVMEDIARLPVPEGLIVLTFDDGSKTHLEFVAPLLKERGFSATFFINHGGGAVGPDESYMSWEEIKQLNDFDMEIANHTFSHMNQATLSEEQNSTEIDQMAEGCGSHGIPGPVSHAYPGSHHIRTCVNLLAQKGYRFARRGISPESHMSDFGDRGRSYDPELDHPLLIPSTLGSGPYIELQDIAWAVDQAKDGKITVLTFHGVPDLHSFCTTTQAAFREYMDYLHEKGCTVIAIRDLDKYVDPNARLGDPYKPIIRRLGVEARDLMCDLDNPKPLFSWQLQSQRRGLVQTAYQILVSSSEESLEKDRGDLWDSGRVDSDETANIAYDGSPLNSGLTFQWKVRSWSRGVYDGCNATAEYYNSEIFKAMSGESEGVYSTPATFVATKTDSGDGESRKTEVASGKESFLLETVAGINLDKSGKRKLLIDPNEMGDLRQGELECKTTAGVVTIRWRRMDGVYELWATIPTNCSARICVPKYKHSAGIITEGGYTIWQNSEFIRGPAGIHSALDKETSVVFETGSGCFHFRCIENR